MKLDEAKIKFIKSWGSLGSKWGINRTLAQIQALFLVTNEPISTEEIMDYLKISRGNVNMNVRTLIDWGLAYKEHKLGERREFFIGEKDLWTIFKRVVKVKKEKEFDPLLDVLQNYKTVDEETQEAQEFTQRIDDIEKFASEAENLLEKLMKMDESWFWSNLVKLMK